MISTFRVPHLFQRLLIGLTTLATSLLLLACNSATNAAPTLQPVLAPTTMVAKPAPTIAAQALVQASPSSVPSSEALPGQLIVVQAGNVWRWRGVQGEQLTSSGDAFQPAISPDGQQLAYARRVTSGSDIVVRSGAVPEPLALTDNTPDPSTYSYDRIYASRWAFYPAWSPDGATLAFASQFGPPAGSPAAEYRMSLYTISAEGAQEQQVFGSANGHVGRPAYAPDGKTIVFAFSPVKEEETPVLYRYTFASDQALVLPDAPQQSYDPAFSPDGMWLAFTARTAGGNDIYAMPAPGGAVVQLTTMGFARAPAFSPDGRMLAFLATTAGSNSFDLWVADVQVDTEGTPRLGEPRQLTTDMHLDADSGISWGR